MVMLLIFMLAFVLFGMEYFIILVLVFLCTALLDWLYKVKLYDSWSERILIPLAFVIIGALWDSFAAWRGHWTFSGTGLLGINIGFLPLEEYLFFLVIPYTVLTWYKVAKSILSNR